MQWQAVHVHVHVRLSDCSMHAWSSYHGRFQGGNDNRNARNLSVKEIPCLYMYMYMYMYMILSIHPPLVFVMHFLFEHFCRMSERF